VLCAKRARSDSRAFGESADWASIGPVLRGADREKTRTFSAILFALSKRIEESVLLSSANEKLFGIRAANAYRLYWGGVRLKASKEE